jgi:cytochrome P450
MGTSTAFDIYNPDWYVDGDFHAAFAELRANDPVFWQPMEGEPGYWAVMRHKDVVSVARNPEVFSASLGGVVLEDLTPERLVQMRNMMLAMDPPHHMHYRRPLAPHFTPNVITTMEQQIRDLTRAIFEKAADKGEVDFINDVAGPLPAQVIAQVMGLPQEDTGMLQRWAEIQVSGQDEEITGAYDAGDAGLEMAMYAIRLAGERRPLPRTDDIFSLLLDTEFEDGRPMEDHELGGFFVQLVTAGNDTTKTMMSTGTYQLVKHPDQLQALRDDPSKIQNAVEEMLRYCNPLHYFRRTATQDVELGGKQIKAGDKVAMMYTSANRDPEVFADPQTFDISRSPNPHLTFGIGGHFCLGVHLARLEAKIFFEELLDTFSGIELLDEPVRIRSNLNNGYKRMPVRLTR